MRLFAGPEEDVSDLLFAQQLERGDIGIEEELVFAVGAVIAGEVAVSEIGGGQHILIDIEQQLSREVGFEGFDDLLNDVGLLRFILFGKGTAKRGNNGSLPVVALLVGQLPRFGIGIEIVGSYHVNLAARGIFHTYPLEIEEADVFPGVKSIEVAGARLKLVVFSVGGVEVQIEAINQVHEIDKREAILDEVVIDARHQAVFQYLFRGLDTRGEKHIDEAVVVVDKPCRVRDVGNADAVKIGIVVDEHIDGGKPDVKHVDLPDILLIELLRHLVGEVGVSLGKNLLQFAVEVGFGRLRRTTRGNVVDGIVHEHLIEVYFGDVGTGFEAVGATDQHGQIGTVEHGIDRGDVNGAAYSNPDGCPFCFRLQERVHQEKKEDGEHAGGEENPKPTLAAPEKDFITVAVAAALFHHGNSFRFV